LDEAANVAGTRFFMSQFWVTYGGTRLPSLDIMDAIGTYDYTGLTVFNFTIDDLSFQPIGLIFTQMTIGAAVPVQPTSWSRVKALYH